MKFILLFVSLTSSFFSISQTYFSLPIQANKVFFDSKRNKLLAIVNGLDMQYGNQLIKINQNTGIVENSIFVGSEPSCLAFTYDSNYVYIGFDGTSMVKRVDLNSFLVDRTISLGNGSFGALFAEDIATIKATPDVIVVARKYFSISPRHAGVAAYKNTAKLLAETPSHTGSNIIETVVGTNQVVGFNTESTESGFRKMVVDTINGVQLISNTVGMPLSFQMEFEDGFIYSNYGKVVDPNLSPPIVVGSFSNNLWSTVSVDINIGANKVFFASVVNSKISFKSYNRQTFAFQNDLLIDGLFPDNFQLPEVIDLESYSKDGIAVIVGENYFNYKDRRLVFFKIENILGIRKEVDKESDLTIFPNPATNSLTIDLPNDVINEIEILDQLGYKINHLKRDSLWNTSFSIDLKGIPNGMYFIAFKSDNKEIIRKLIIQN